jgi:hypothetical protein
MWMGYGRIGKGVTNPGDIFGSCYWFSTAKATGGAAVPGHHNTVLSPFLSAKRTSARRTFPLLNPAKQMAKTQGPATHTYTLHC